MVRLLSITYPSLTLIYLASVWQLFSTRAMFVTYAKCNSEVIMHSASSINPMCLIPYLASLLPCMFAGAVCFVISSTLHTRLRVVELFVTLPFIFQLI